MFGSRPLRFVRLLAAVPACWAAAGVATPAMAEDVWSSLATVSASAPLASGRVCYSDGRDIACDVNAPTLASLTAPLTLGLDDLIDVTTSVSLNSIWAGYQAGGLGTASATSTTAFGHQALGSNISGINNTAFGYRAMVSNTSGNNNVAVGLSTLTSNTTGLNNTAIGPVALMSNETGSHNTAVGRAALHANIAGSNNNAFGQYSLQVGQAGSNNSGFGNGTLMFNDSGSNNTALGTSAGRGAVNQRPVISDSVFVGFKSGYAISSSTGNILMGYQAGDNITTGSYNIVIGYDADPVAATGSNQLNIGNTIYGDLGLKRLGIGVTSPTANLSVSGSFIVTAADSGCTTDTIGTMRVNAVTKRLQLCLDR